MTIPKGKAVTVKVTVIPNSTSPELFIDGAATSAHLFKQTESYTIPKNDTKDQSISIKNSFAGIELSNGEVSVLKINDSEMKTVVAENVGLTTFEVGDNAIETLDISDNKLTGSFNGTNLPSLKTLDASNNEYTAFSGEFNSTVIETINFANNKIASASFANLTSLKTLDVSGNELTRLGVPSTLTSLNIDGNKLKEVTGAPEKGVDWGIQEIGAISITAQANTNLSLKGLAQTAGLVGGNAENYKASQWKKKDNNGNFTIDATNEAQMLDAQSPDKYRFFDKNTKVYQSGDYQCVLTDSKDRAFRVEFTVNPAKFNMQLGELSHGRWIVKANNVNQNLVSGNTASVTQGDKLSVDVMFDGSDDTGYKLSKFTDIQGLTSTDWNKTPLDCTVEGKYESEGKDIVPAISAEIIGESYKVNYSETDSQTEGTVIVQKKEANGEWTSVERGASVPYNTTLKVTVTPRPGYSYAVKIDDKPISMTDAGNSMYTHEFQMKDNCNIHVSFTKQENVSLDALINGEKLTGTASIEVSQGGNTQSIQANTPISVKRGELCRMKISLGSSVLTQVLVNKKDYTQPTLVTHKVEKGSNIYYVEFTPEEDAIIYITTGTKQMITIVPTDGETQEYMYDNAPKAFLFTTTPSNLEDKVVVSYKAPADAGTSTTAPTEVGNYTVSFSLKEGTDATYSIDKKTYKLNIKQAVPTITKVPDVTVEDGEYVLKNGTASVEGIFSVNESTVKDDASHLVTVTFTPKDTKNYTTAQVETEVVIDGKPMDRMAVNIESVLPNGVSVSLLNDESTPAEFGDKFVAGMKLIVLVSYPEGVDADDVKLYKTLRVTSKEEITDTNDTYTNPTTRVKAFEYTVPTGTDAEKLDVEIVGELKEYKGITLSKLDPIAYTGKTIFYDKAGGKVTVLDENGEEMSNVSYTLSYKSGNTVIAEPTTVGNYTVCVSINAGNGYAAYSKEFPNALVIKKTIPVIVEWPTACPIAKGQKLKFADLVGGGSSSISGDFDWVDNKETTYPKNGDKKAVKFIPDDQVNYETVTSGEKDYVVIIVTEEQLVTKSVGNGGTVKIVNNATGTEMQSGSVITKGMVLKITATPDEDFELESLSVTGATNNGNGTYTVGETSVEVEATFSVKVLPGNFKVTIPEGGVRGAIITGGGQYVVAQGGSISFTVSTLAADANKVSVTATNGTVSKGANGRYTVSNIQANTTVRVSLSNPTALKVDIKESYLNDKKYHIGYVEIADGEATTYYYGDEITVVAYPESGVKFKGWSNGSTDQVLDLVLTGDLTLTASFTGTPTGIEDIETAKVYTGKGFIMVKNVANAEVTVVSISGRLQAKRAISGDTQIMVPQGIYVVVLQSGDDTKQLKVIVK